MGNKIRVSCIIHVVVVHVHCTGIHLENRRVLGFNLTMYMGTYIVLIHVN